MRTRTDIMDLIRLICDFYEAYRDTLGMSHEDARAKVEQTYDDLHEWLYPEAEPEYADDEARKKRQEEQRKKDIEAVGFDVKDVDG